MYVPPKKWKGHTVSALKNGKFLKKVKKNQKKIQYFYSKPLTESERCVIMVLEKVGICYSIEEIDRTHPIDCVRRNKAGIQNFF